VTFVAALAASSVAVVALLGAGPASKPHHGSPVPTSTTTPVPVPGGASSDLNGVSCATASACMAVGTHLADYSASGVGLSRGFSEVWAGSAWQLATAAQASGGAMTAFDAVSCPSPSMCVAVGQAGEDPSDVERSSGFSKRASPLAEEWDGHRWALMDLPTVPNGILDGIACPSVDVCVAVGSVAAPGGYTDEGLPLAELWSHGVWARMTLPPFVSATLAAVSCPSPSGCYAVGEETVSVAAGRRGEMPLALAWDGTGWAATKQPGLWDSFPPAGFDGYPDSGYTLAGVSCSSPTSCAAVGFFHTATAPETYLPLLEYWDGSSWSLGFYEGGLVPGTAPPPYLAGDPSLQGVACPREGRCVAVGAVNDSCGQEGLAEACTFAVVQAVARWEPEETGIDYALLNAVSCPARTTCVAVGEHGTGTVLPLIMRRNGTSWSTAPVQPPG
jgi:hypothetical protein